MNKSARLKRSFLVVAAIAVGTLYVGTWRAEADFIQTNLVSDLAGLNATIIDPELHNPWGISHTDTSPFWVSNQGTSTATLYGVTAGNDVAKVNINPPSGFVAIPPLGGPGPTGQVANTNTSSFAVGMGGDGGSAHFIFANLNGSISAWDTGATAFTQVTTPGAVYTGLAINQAQTQLYAANGAGSGSIDVFNSSFGPVTNLPPGAFTTPQQVPNGFVPFNVQNINGNIYVTYAPPGRTAQTMATPGMGAVAVFTENGTFLRMAADSSPLAAPWGLALAPAGFGPFGGDLFVGNFSFMASEINVFDSSGNFLFTIPINIGGNAPGGLWALGFGTGGMNGSPNTLFFTDGINGERDGLFGALNVPGPIVGAGLPGLILAGGVLLLLARRRRQQTA